MTTTARASVSSPLANKSREVDVSGREVGSPRSEHYPTAQQQLPIESVDNPPLFSIEIRSTKSLSQVCSFMEDEVVSLPGSLTSADEEFDCKPSSFKYNPTRLSNPDPYKGWDALLTELKASGRTLQDSDSTDNSSASSYGSNSFESGCVEIT